MSSVSKSNTDDKKILKKSEKQWFVWRFQDMIDKFDNLKKQFYAISKQLIYPIQVTEELKDEQDFIVHQKKSILQKIEDIIKELNMYPQLLHDHNVDQVSKFMIAILDFLRSQLYDNNLYQQPYNYLIYDDIQLNHELLKMFINIMSNMDHLIETKQMLQEQCLQLLVEKSEQLYNIVLFSSDSKKKFRMQIIELELLIKRQMEPLEKQSEYFSHQLKLINNVMDKTFQLYELLYDFSIDMLRNYEEDLRNSQLELIKLLLLPWSIDWIMESYRNLNFNDLEYILSDYYLEERVEFLQQLIN